MLRRPPADPVEIASLICDLNSARRAVRESAIKRLIAIGKDAIPALIVAVTGRGQNWKVANRAGRVLERIGGPDVRSALYAERNHRDRRVRWRVTDSLFNLGQSTPLLTALEDRSAYVRDRAVARLPWVRLYDIDLLISALEKPTIREICEGVLVRRGTALIPHLLTQLEHPVPEVRQAIVRILQRISDSVDGGAGKYSDEEDETDSNSALADGLAPLLASSDPTLRVGVASWFVGYDDPRGVTSLVDSLNDTNGVLRGRALDILATCGGRATIPAIVRCLSDTNGGVRAKAAIALRSIGGEEALKALIGAANDPDVGVRWSVVDGLAEFRESEAIAALVAAQTDSEKMVANRATKALAEIGNCRS